MFSTEMPSEMKELLLDITPNFDENLKRVSKHLFIKNFFKLFKQAFRNEGVRLQRIQNANRYIHQLDDILLSIDDTKM